MTRISSQRPQVDHFKVVETLRSHPNTWQLAGMYRSRATAHITAYSISLNRYSPAYAEGEYETDYQPDDGDGYWEVWVRLVQE